MTPAARIAAAIEVLEDIESRRRPVADALKDWGLAHRFAGSGDRAGIADAVYDTLRRRASLAWALGDDTPRLAVLAAALPRPGDATAAAGAWKADRHAPALAAAEISRLEAAAAGVRLAEAPAWVRGDYPEFLDGSLAGLFGAERVAEGEALTRRPPTDLRANALHCNRNTLLAAFRDKPLAEAEGAVEPTPWSPFGVRLAASLDTRRLAPTATAEFLRGDFEIQDEGSQLAALIAGARPGEIVVDLCAGGGGKTLALAAAMENQGRLIAYDADARRLAKSDERIRRAGASVAELRFPGRDPLGDLAGQADLVFIDAPCTGTGTWRRSPDTKWRIRPNALAQRQRDQAQVLAQAAPLVRPGGRMAYVTCSLLPEENDSAIDAFLAASAGFAVAPVGDAVRAALPERGEAFLAAVRATRHGVQMSPLRTGTDGFYVALLVRR